MARSEATRAVGAAPEDVWAIVADPHHLVRWWPRVTRVEGVGKESFTEVLSTSKGRPVRADFTVVESQEPTLRRWRQEIAGTPFAGFLARSETEVRLSPGEDGAGTRVLLAVDETPHGVLARLGTVMLRRAARRRLDEALDGLARIVGG